jgi:hypothetical protein
MAKIKAEVKRQRVQTAEGWKRMMIRKRKEEKTKKVQKP